MNCHLGLDSRSFSDLEAQKQRRLQRSEEPVKLVVRTRQGIGFHVEGNNSFRLDESGSLLILKCCPDQRPEILRISDITSAVLANADAKLVIEQLRQRLTATPFLPCHVVLLPGGRHTISKPQDVLVTTEALYLAAGKGASDVKENALEIPWAWIERFEALPS